MDRHLQDGFHILFRQNRAAAGDVAQQGNLIGFGERNEVVDCSGIGELHLVGFSQQPGRIDPQRLGDGFDDGQLDLFNFSLFVALDG